VTGAGAESPAGFRPRAYHLLALVPSIGMLGGVPFANRVHTLVFGLPVLLLWILLWVLATAACMTVLYRIDQRVQPQREPDHPVRP
jgi:hypothetical protein